MKKLIFTCCLLTMMMTMGAQRYMRYHMNDSTFNGFYTDCVDSILHSVDLTQVYANGQVYEIPLANVDSVTFEGVNLATDADDMVGRYRIYEYEVSPTDSMYKIYKKAYFDNRALLITSKTGEFGANDAIMIQSEFYGGRLLMFTDGEGNICRIFDGNYMLDILYHKDGSSTVHLFSESSDSILATLELPIDLFDKYSYTRAVSVSSLQKALKGFAKKFKQDILPQLKPYLKEKAVTTLLVEGAVKLGEVLTDIESDPNYHNRVLLIDGVQVVGDLVGIGITALGGTLTGGALWAALGVEYGLLMKDFHELMEDCLPSSEVTKKYKKYYEQKYGLMLHTLSAVEVTETSATLKGNVYTTDGIKGNVYFRLWDYKDYDKDVSATIEGHDDNYKYSLSARLEDLTPDKEYVYYVCYECTINGMTFIYYSDDCVEFRTKEKSDEPTPGEAIDLGLSVKWASHNVGASSPEGYGGYYAWGETEEKNDYGKNNYMFYNSSIEGFDYIGFDISGTQYDVAYVKWGGSWRMPTRDEIVELVNKCTWKWTTQNSVNGLLVTGPSGKSIFLPAAGFRNETSLYNRGSYGFYWSTALSEGSSSSAYYFDFDNRGKKRGGFCHRYYGYTVRPVTEGVIKPNDGNEEEVIPPEKPADTMEAVDLGLPSGLKWATCNVGASKPEDYGDYYAWGEITPLSFYDDTHSTASSFFISELKSRGIIDPDGNLTSTHDAATANWGDSWRIPTLNEIMELVNKCTWKWTTKNGINGQLVTGPNGNSIFLPVPGYRYGTAFDNRGSYGYYWSATPYDNIYDAYRLFITDASYSWRSNGSRAYGYAVRPVTE